MNKELLISVLGQQAESSNNPQQHIFLAWIARHFNDAEISFDEYANMYVTKGKASAYPCIVAHVDQVHDYNENFRVVEVEGKLFGMDHVEMERVGVGGDDKCGVYLAMRMFELLDAVKLVFFKDEEIGCLGSGKANMDFFNDCAFVLQGDRRSLTTDFITHTNGTKCCSKKFLKAIRPTLSKYGYTENYGTITDVGELKNKGLDISCANVSCGYFDAHTKWEYVDIDLLENCENLFYDLCTNFAWKQWKHTPSKRWTPNWEYYGNPNRKQESFDRWAEYENGAYEHFYDDEPPAQSLLTERIMEDPNTLKQCAVCQGYDTQYDPFDNLIWCFSCDEYVDEQEELMLDDLDLDDNIRATVKHAYNNNLKSLKNGKIIS